MRSVEVPWRPLCANSMTAASRISSRRSSAVLRSVSTGVMAGMLVNAYFHVKPPEWGPVPTATIAPSYTLLGKLQRGLGAGYLEALRIERDAAHELLFACLAEDPRHDPRTEARGRYYGELCLETRI